MRFRQMLMAVTTLLLLMPVFVLAGDYDHKISVDKVTFEWKLDGKNINVRLQAETEGWVGIGFNPSEDMKDANFILGYVKKGSVKVTDHFGTSKRQHKADKKLDGKNDVTNAAGKEADGVTEISFTIPLDSDDAKDAVIAADKETTVLLAYGAGRDSFRSKHKFRTALKVNLTTGKYTEAK